MEIEKYMNEKNVANFSGGKFVEKESKENNNYIIKGVELLNEKKSEGYETFYEATNFVGTIFVLRRYDDELNIEQIYIFVPFEKAKDDYEVLVSKEIF